MPVPSHILSVPRPVNTIVEDRKTDSPKRYAVRARDGYTRSASGRIAPKNGKVIGYIIDGHYAEKAAKSSVKGPYFLSYGSAALIKSVSDDLLIDLFKIFPPNEAYSILCAAGLRVIYPGVTDSRLSSRYEKSFLSQYFPGAALSKNTISSLETRIGQDPEKRKQFYALHLEQVEAKDQIAIDGMLKQDNSSVNDLSAFSFKGRTKGVKDISVIFAYDIERQEPLAAEVFAGNKIDAANYSDFLKRTGIDRGVLIADKGFPVSSIEDLLNNRPNLSYLSPLKRNDTRIVNNRMYDYEGSLVGTGRTVQYKKAHIKGGKFLYSFCDVERSAKEARDWIEREKDPLTGNYDVEKFRKKEPTFGTVVFLSNLDMTPLQAYRCYEERWMIETVFNHYKNDIDLDVTRVEGDGTVTGSEFINFIATIMTCRILRKATKAGVFDRMSYQQMMEDLRSVQRFVTGGIEMPLEDDEYWNNPTQAERRLIREMELCIPKEEPKPKKRGRPRKEVDPAEAAKSKRRRGRPRKNPIE